ncbi:MAG TPA: PIG-L family deacetylase [Caulobacteraceae bacterium]|jgi:LmbE family N-acetylglucosaminyl deacetylase|nr:PIG-L family deacetylase [Caulobacteraceae bacterium]
MTDYATLLDAIADPERADIDARQIAIVTAHPDDETLAFGVVMRRLKGVRLVLATDGSPRDMHTARRLGLPSVEAYRDARHAELLAAMAVAGLPPAALTRLEAPDKEAVHNLGKLAAQLRAFFARHGVRGVLTHAYEGGHPDHDAVAAAVALATRGSAIEVIEAPFYRSRDGRYSVHSFAPAPGIPIVETPLKPEEAAHKLAMIACYPTQAGIFKGYTPRFERFRHAPAYDFAAPPNDGAVDYERGFFPWSEWAKAVRPALDRA